MQALGARGARRRACVGARARAQVVAGRWASGRTAGARDSRGARQGRGSSAQGAQATGRRNASRHGVGAQGRAAEHTVRAGHDRPGRGLGAGWVRRLGQF